MSLSLGLFYFLLAISLVLATRVIIWLGHASARLVMALVRIGLYRQAKALLQLVAYDRNDYLKSSSIYWNKVEVRFMLFWAIWLLLLAFLYFLKQGHVIESMGVIWTLSLVGYVGYRCVVTLGDDELTEREELRSSNLKEGQTSYYCQWNYLDDLFSV